MDRIVGELKLTEVVFPKRELGSGGCNAIRVGGQKIDQRVLRNNADILSSVETENRTFKGLCFKLHLGGVEEVGHLLDLDRGGNAIVGDFDVAVHDRRVLVLVLQINGANGIVDHISSRDGSFLYRVLPKREHGGFSVTVAVGYERRYNSAGAVLHDKGAAGKPCGLIVGTVELAERLKAESPVRAKPIPVLPVHVTAADMGPIPKHTVPVGFSKQGVEPYFFNTTKFAYMLVVGEDTDMLGSYFKGMRETFIANGAKYRFIDDARLMGDLDDPWVLTTSDEAEAFVRSLPPKPLQAEYYVFTNPIKTLAGLSETGKSWLTDLWVNERTKHRVVMVAGIEAMRTKGYVEQWYMFFKQSGAGLWIGTGFGNQMIFQYGRMMPEYNQPAGPTDGFVSFRGQAASVRILEPAPQGDTGASA